MQVPLVNVSRLRGFTQSVSQYFVSSEPQTEAGASVWVCCACKARPVVAARAKCGHLFCHVCSIRQRSVSTPSSLIFIWVNQGELEGGRNHFQHCKEIELLCLQNKTDSKAAVNLIIHFPLPAYTYWIMHAQYCTLIDLNFVLKSVSLSL